MVIGITGFIWSAQWSRVHLVSAVVEDLVEVAVEIVIEVDLMVIGITGFTLVAPLRRAGRFDRDQGQGPD
ncbi:hypothetical protein SA496_20180 [Pseudomonas sp. JS3066]|uniref:hypothetical protein n=1 Tax=Pseudomonas sp. JS3066 TaxID=3090665 RepID=UPI002E7B90CA|nr:hypothetical protein [Pseudomonas sp. JS3066]WVK92020.1 hypothetical protein SA496_20180 [Pseudomonas sp. JS3066]